MSSAEGSKGVLHCIHCGREVGETMHMRSSYRVDYYSLHTGDVEPATVARHDDPTESMTVLRLIRPVDVFTCVECYRKPSIRDERELTFRPELVAAPHQQASS
jgi:hypothetical protein